MKDIFIELAEDIDFSTEFSTYCIAFCLDTISWFITKQRFWYFQFDELFITYEEALNWFENSIDMIIKTQNDLLGHQRFKDVYLELEDGKCKKYTSK